MLPSVLKGHAKTHNGYTCDAEGCKEEFTLWSLLVKHKAEAHPKSNYFIYSYAKSTNCSILIFLFSLQVPGM